jgi:hypothetical protein
VPEETPVTNPDVEFTEKLPLKVDQVPAGTELFIVMLDETHTGAFPEKVPGTTPEIALQLPIPPDTKFDVAPVSAKF